MSRSRRKTPVDGMTTARSEKQDKRLYNRRYRRVISKWCTSSRSESCCRIFASTAIRGVWTRTVSTDSIHSSTLSACVSRDSIPLNNFAFRIRKGSALETARRFDRLGAALSLKQFTNLISMRRHRGEWRRSPGGFEDPVVAFPL